MSTQLLADEVTVGEIAAIDAFAQSLPEGSAVAVVLQMVVSAMKRGADVNLFVQDKELTPNQVADLLQVSRPHVTRLMDRGLLAYRSVGSHRRVAMDDLLDYVDRHERANAHIAHLLGIRGHGVEQDASSALTKDDLAALAALRQ